MYLATLVSDIQKVLEGLRVSRGAFALAMLYSSFEGGEGGWNLIVSGPWADELGSSEATLVVARALQQGLGMENRPLISRVTVLPTNDPFVMEITSLFHVAGPGSAVHITNSTFGGVHVPRGVLFYAQRPVPAAR